MLNNVHGIAVDAETRRVFVNDRTNHRLHGVSVDQNDNFYVNELDGGRMQKFRPRQGANPAYIVSKPVDAAWK